jgi:glyceraldehyde 3-phosphate dehydrogenase
MSRFLYGHTREIFKINIVDESQGMLEIDGFPVKILRNTRNPKDINWANEGVRLVIDCTGQFNDPTLPPDSQKGSIRAHLTSGAEKVIVSAPFNIKDPSKELPRDSEVFVYGVNHFNFDPSKHHIISAASCTTTGLAHMIKPLLETQETSKILTASMSTVHAVTNKQSILDSVPQSGTSDLRKNRSVFNNIILTTTGAATALEKILPDILKVGFMADSVRIPINTVSLITLNITFHTSINKQNGKPVINREFINNIYENAAIGSSKGLLTYSSKQNVSSDLLGYESAIIIEGHETHTRTGFANIPTDVFKEYGIENAPDIQLPVTHAKIFGWYDNEYGSYVTCLGKLTVYINKNMK